ncbi:MAG: ATP-binding protein [Chloroflexota bacterium]
MDHHLYNEELIRKKLETTASQQEKIDLLIDLAYLIRFSNLEETASLLEQAEQLAHQGIFANASYLEGPAKIKVVLASIEFKKARYDQSIQYVNEAILDLEGSTETIWESRAHNILGSCFGQLGDHSQSVQSLSVSLESARRGGHKREIANALNVLATFEDNKVDMYLEAIELSKEIGNQEIHSIASANLARSYIELNEFEKAENALKVAEEISKSISYWSLLGYVNSTQGTLYREMGQPEKAVEKIQVGIRLAREREDFFIVCSNLEELARLEMEMGNTDLALAHVEEALNIAADINEQIMTQSLFKLKADCLAKQGRFEEALEYAWRFTHIKNESFNQEITKQRQSLIISHQAETHKLQAKLEKDKNIELEQLVKERTVALQGALEQAQAANVARDRFLAMMSHELRTPINAIIGYSEIIEDVLDEVPESDDMEEIQHASENVLSAAQNLLGLVTDVLEISHLESGRTAIKPQSVQLERLISELCNLVQPLMLKNQNQLTVENTVCLQTITTDYQKLQQILSNLLNNAAKFTKEGSVTFKVSQPADHQLLFEIVDTGIGISQKELEIIFEPFMQVENTYNRKFDGVGLGLAISKQHAAAIGGELILESELNKGTACGLTIPTKLKI